MYGTLSRVPFKVTAIMFYADIKRFYHTDPGAMLVSTTIIEGSEEEEERY